MRAFLRRDQGDMCVAECASIFARLVVFRQVPSMLCLRSSRAAITLQSAARRMSFARAEIVRRKARLASRPQPMRSWLVGYASSTLRLEDEPSLGVLHFQSVHGGVPTSSHPGGVEITGSPMWPPLDSEWQLAPHVGGGFCYFSVASGSVRPTVPIVGWEKTTVGTFS